MLEGTQHEWLKLACVSSFFVLKRVMTFVIVWVGLGKWGFGVLG
jgi:hypothetical protein